MVLNIDKHSTSKNTVILHKTFFLQRNKSDNRCSDEKEVSISKNAKQVYIQTKCLEVCCMLISKAHSYEGCLSGKYPAT